MIRPGCAAKLLQRAQMGVVRRGKFPYRSYMVECRMETNPTAATVLLLRNLYTLIKITWAYLQLERGCSVGSSFNWVCKFLTVCFKNTMYSAAFVKISIFVLKSLLLGRSSFKTVKAFRSTFTRLCSLLFFLTRLCSMLLISFRAPSWYTSTVYIDFP